MFAIVFGRFAWGGAGWVDTRAGATIATYPTIDRAEEVARHHGYLSTCSVDWRIVRLA